jgi:hypothetical protein
VLRTSTGAVSLGCNPAEYTNVTGALVVVKRGTCARVARAVFGQQAGAAAVLMINNVDALPPFEGPITGNPDTGEQFNVTIPFLGVKSSDEAALVAADGGTASLSAFSIPNPGFLALASFSSGGPRTGDSWLKPDVTAPGVSIFSVGVGTGNGFAVISGTSMASPHTAGMAALVRQAHPSWKKVPYWKAAIVNTADPGKVADYNTRGAGAGLIQAPGATSTQVIALGNGNTATLNYGFAELGRDYSETKTITLRNFGNRSARFNVAGALPSGSPHTVGLSRTSVTVPARDSVDVRVTLRVPAATVGDLSQLRDVAGLVTFTPVSGANKGVALRVPYYLVPQAVSNIETKIDARQLANTGSATATVTNRGGVVTGTADWYAWGLSDPRERDVASNDVRAVGVQSFPADDLLFFAISTQDRWSNASMNEYDIFIDANRDGTDDYLVVGIDLGAITAGDSNGELAVAVFDLATGDGSLFNFAIAPLDSTTLLLPVVISEQLCATPATCLSPANPRFSYHASVLGLTDDSEDVVAGVASFNAFTPAISNGMFDVVAPGATATETVTINAAEFAQTPPLGLMIVSHDNRNDEEATTVRVRLP